MKVVLADKEQVLLESLASVLSRTADVEIVGAFTHGSALAGAMRLLSPDVIVTGLRLADGPAFDLLPELMSAHQESKVIVLTSSHAEADLVLALDAGVDGYLCKECSVADLVRALREVYEGGFYAGPWAAGAMRTRSTASAGATLTSREIEVLCSLQCGHTTEEIAAQLLLSPSSVKTHLGNIYRKLDARNRVEALHEATRRGIIGD